ncbi:MAG: helix-turn-helix domain-containing protein [Chloroflexales bacterium]|nr:helix-turn-helix domain-containing protein [Chloroflexales bacterium]
MPTIATDIQQLEDLAAKGLTLAEISAALGISESTLYRRERAVTAVTGAIKKGQARGA